MCVVEGTSLMSHEQPARRHGRRQFLKSLSAGAAGVAVAGTLTRESVAAQQVISIGDTHRSVWFPNVVVPDAELAGTRTLSNAFDLNNGNAPVEVIIPRVIPIIFEFVSAVANDATLVLRITALLTNAWFDAIAPYHPTAVGVYSKLGRRPASEATIANKNTAILFASYRVLLSVLSRYTNDWRDMLVSAGLDPDDDGQDTTTATGIGNVAGSDVVAARERDGMNQLGDEGGRAFNRQPYADYLGYEPVNTAYDLRNASRWQPQIVTRGNGIFQVQQFVTPQLRMTRPYSYDDPGIFQTPRPVMGRGTAYRQQAEEVLAASASLTDYQKMVAELYDNKLFGIGFSALVASQLNGLTLDEFVHYDFLTNVASFDTAIACWNEKLRHDYVRPVSAIRYLYGDDPVTAWGGPGKGTVNDLPANEWRSYLGTADHPEHPSGSASFCSAHAEASRLFFGDDNFGWSIHVPAGPSVVEPGITPSQDIVIGPWNTWTESEQECGLSRLWGGVHFMPSITAGQDLGRAVGKLAFDFVQAHINGDVD